MKALVVLLALSACAPLIGPPPNDNPPDAAPVTDDSGMVIIPGKVTTTTNADGSATSKIDSTSTTDWTYVDLHTFTETTATGAWGLRFQRFHISVNGGVSGTGGVDVAPVPNATLADVTTAPTTGYIVDQPDGDDEDTIPEYAFDQGDSWYDYNQATHILTAKKMVWVVRSPDITIKLAIEKYYDMAGTAGWFTVTWRKL